MKVYATAAQQKFGKALAKRLKVSFSGEVGHYPDGQTYVVLKDIPDHYEDVVVVGNTFGAEQFEEFRLLMHTLHRKNIGRMAAVIPYFGAGRQDRSKVSGQDVAAHMQADEISARRPDWVLLMDLHHDGILHFFDDDWVRARELSTDPLFLAEMKRLRLKRFVVASPDVGRFTLAQFYAKKLGVEAATLDKRRAGPGQAAVFHVVGDVARKDVILVDDIIDSGGTVFEGAKALQAAGAENLHLFATHLVLSGTGEERFSGKTPFASLHATDTIDTSGKRHRFTIHSVAPLFADYIKNILPRKRRNVLE